MPTSLYANGRAPLTVLDGVPAANGQVAWLLPLAAESLLDVMVEIERRHGWECLVTSAGDGFRSYERQVNVFRARYRPTYSTVMQNGRLIVDRRTWDGVTYWRHTGPAAAVPGTSNHGWGATADLTGLGGYGTARFNQASAILTAHGWSNAEGRSVSEPWHWTYTRTAYPVVNTNTIPGVTITVPNVPTLKPIAPEDELTPDQDQKLTTAAVQAQTAAQAADHATDAANRAAEVAEMSLKAASTAAATAQTIADELRRLRADLNLPPI